MSLRGFGRISSSCSLLGLFRTSSSSGFLRVSVMNLFEIGSSVSIRSTVRIGQTGSNKDMCSILNFVSIGSFVSVRSMARLSSGFSVAAPSKYSRTFIGESGKTTTSIVDYCSIGSSMSVRSMVRSMGSMNTVDYLHIASTLSLREI